CIKHLGSKNFPRLKIGIGRPLLPIPPEKYVLSSFEPNEQELIGQRLAAAEEGIKNFVRKGITAAMNMVNRKE
ncbi:MAG: aminoacyl-tRNA hydrolase, partial [Deltaproteobacteria bacterium]|nr:aminoacyl-tRNA hydrolase [Deltaproteobacteria bacterium]